MSATLSDRELLQQLRDACFAMQMEARARNCGLLICDEAIAAADARLSQPVQSHEAWVEQMMGIVTHISELHSRCLRHDTKALHDAWTAKKAELRAHLNNHPAAMPEPISSAPRDGTAILLGARCGWWIGKWKPVYTSGFKPDRAWFSLMLNHDHMTEKWEEPTHWMPLPKAMIAATKAGKE